MSEQTALAEFYQAVSNSQTTLFFVSVYIECYGRNEEDLQSTIRAVEEKLITANISAERLIRQQREGFLSVSPLGRDYFLADANNFPSQTVAACYPCSYSSRLDLHGMFLGYTMSGGNFFLDILQRQANVTNSSFCIIGAAGQGKSWLMKKIITFLRMFGVRSFSLDPENEVLVQKAIAKLVEGKTVIMIAHRLRTVVDADQILVLDEGKLVEQGTHEELMREKGLYQKLFHIQQESLGWAV